VPITGIVPAILGARARLDDPATWDCPQLISVATTKQIRAMVNKAMTELKQVADTKSVMKCVDFDDLIDLTLNTLMSCYAIAQERLELAFMMQDKVHNKSIHQSFLFDFQLSLYLKFICIQLYMYNNVYSVCNYITLFIFFLSFVFFSPQG
jgi:hypothetical protein